VRAGVPKVVYGIYPNYGGRTDMALERLDDLEGPMLGQARYERGRYRETVY
jgi:hypothetical protein